MDWQPECGAKVSILSFCILIAIFISAVSGSETAVSTYDKEIRQKVSVLDSVKNELEKGRAKLMQLQKEEGDYSLQLEQIEKNVSNSKAYLKILSLRIDSINVVIGSLQDSLKSEEKRLADRQEIMRRRLRQIYMTGDPQLRFLLLVSGNPVEILHKIRYMSDLNMYDRKMVHDVAMSRQNIDNKKAARQEERKNLENLLNEKMVEQAALLHEEDMRKQMLEKIRTQKSAFALMIAELEAAQDALNKIIETLEKKRKAAKKESVTGVPFAKKMGKLPWPIKGTVTTNFGKIVHPVYKTVILNNGIDISGSSGQAVRSVSSGTIIHVGAMRGLGRLVIIAHDAGYISVYANLEQITAKIDQHVQAGTTIGQIASAASGKAQLHFEIRNQTEALDPMQWLEK